MLIKYCTFNIYNFLCNKIYYIIDQQKDNISKMKNFKLRKYMFIRDNAVWAHEMDNVLLDSMLKEDHKGNRPDGIWNTTTLIIC